MFSALSRYQSDEEQFNSIFFKFQRVIALIVFPIGVGVWVYHDLATLILLGDQWTETAGFLGMRALLQAFLIVFSYYNSEAFRSKGKPQLSLIAQSIYLVSSIPILYFGACKDYETLTLCSIAAGLILIACTSTISHFTIKIKFHKVFKNILPQLTASIVMGLFGYTMLMISKNIIWQIASVIMCMIVYFTALLVLFPKTRRELLSTPLAKKIMAKFKRKPLNESRENNEF
jgi:PST family polysaccharide transporter